MQPPEDEDDSWVNLCLFCIVWSGLVKTGYYAIPHNLICKSTSANLFQILHVQNLEQDAIRNLCNYHIQWGKSCSLKEKDFSQEYFELFATLIRIETMRAKTHFQERDQIYCKLYASANSWHKIQELYQCQFRRM